MQTAHLGTTGTSSAISMLKFNVGTNVSAATESFGFAWLRETGRFADSRPGKADSGGTIFSSNVFEPIAESAESEVKGVVGCQAKQAVGTATKGKEKIETANAEEGKTIRPAEPATGTATKVPGEIAAENATKASSDEVKGLSKRQGEGHRRKVLRSSDPQDGSKPQLETAQQPKGSTKAVDREAGVVIATGPAAAQCKQEGAEPATDGVRRQIAPVAGQTKGSVIPVSLRGAGTSAKASLSKGVSVESGEPGMRLRKTEAVSPSVLAADCHADVGNAVAVSPVPQGSHAGVISAAVQMPSSGHVASAAAYSPARQGLANAASEPPGATQLTISSGPPRLDVAVFDGTYGWLRIRTELGAHGQVTASLVAASGAAHDSLRAAVPEMANYLTSESVSVSRIAVHRVADSSTAIAAQAEGQRGRGMAEHSQQEREMTNCGDATRRSSPETEGSSFEASRIEPSAGGWGGIRGSNGTEALKDWLGGLSRVAVPLGLCVGFGRNSGGWVNVCV